MSNIFEQLAPLAETKKQQTTVAKFIEKGFKFTRQSDAQKFTFLVYDFFVAGNMPAVQLCIDYLEAQGYPTAENEKKFLNWVFMEPVYYLKYFISDASTQKKLHHDLLNLWYESSKRQLLEQDKGKHDEAYIDAWNEANVNKTLSIIRSGETIASCKEDVAKHSRTLNDEYEQNVNLLDEYCRALLYTAETTESQQELVAETQSHIALLKDLYKKVNKIK